MRAALFFVYEDMNLENSLTYLFSQIILAVLTLGPVNSPVVSPWPDLQCQACISSYEAGLKSNEEVVIYLHNIHTTIAQDMHGHILLKMLYFL